MDDCDAASRKLFEELRDLERELHKDETRRDQTRMEMLLHPHFIEFGRSGRRYARGEIISEFGPDNVLPFIQSSDFEMVVLGEGVALLTYVSAHVDGADHAHRHSLRSSIWVRTPVGWQMRFHQGTPIPEGER
jgi:hypothetical protein